jgi:hypothetical protein
MTVHVSPFFLEKIYFDAITLALNPDPYRQLYPCATMNREKDIKMKADIYGTYP